MRPTGRLHIGHYFGALQNWVKLQNDPTYDCFYFIADWHALTSDYADTSAIAENAIQIAIDYLASGLVPTKSTIFLQSLVPEHAELHLLLSMVTPLGWLERLPTYKEQIENVANKDLHTYGFLGYPTLQTADIVMYSDPGKSLSVPVGEDQVSHVEFSRELVRRFNFLYSFATDSALKLEQHLAAYLRVGFRLPSENDGGKTLCHALQSRREWTDPQRVELWSYGTAVSEWDLFQSEARQYAIKIGFDNFLERMGEDRGFFEGPGVLEEPGVLLTPTPRIPGLDGRKMSKSYGNAITLSETDANIRSKTKVMVTDPARKRRSDPGNPDICPVYDWHKLFSPKETLDWAAEGCRTAGIGCIECKAKMADHLIQWIEPVRTRRVEYEQHPKRVLEILDAGSSKARETAKQTMHRVREAIFNWTRKRQEIAGASS
jgi:tryptophanyl-tRNA synthetase